MPFSSNGHIYTARRPPECTFAQSVTGHRPFRHPSKVLFPGNCPQPVTRGSLPPEWLLREVSILQVRSGLFVPAMLWEHACKLETLGYRHHFKHPLGAPLVPRTKVMPTP